MEVGPGGSTQGVLKTYILYGHRLGIDKVVKVDMLKYKVVFRPTAEVAGDIPILSL